MPGTAQRAAIFLVCLALLRIALTFCVFSETPDESTHVAVGLHIWMRHRFAIQLENPPLVPLVLALPPLLAGVRFPPDADYFAMLNTIFYSLPSYRASLFLARSGNLLFFAAAAIAIWLWARRELGDRGALIALLLFTMEPILLGYSGLATHDCGAIAGVAMSLFAFSRWLERLSWTRAMQFGVAFGFAVLCKFSCLVFVPAGCAAVMAVRLLRDHDLRQQWRRFATLTASVLTAVVVVWPDTVSQWHPHPRSR